MTRHVIVGAGPVGSTLATVLADDGHDVRVVTRSGSGPEHPGIELARADATDSDALRRLTAGAATLYNCVNPPGYQHWAKMWPPLAASFLRTAEATGAVLVMMGNLYGYGSVDGPISRDHPVAPIDHKGELRARMWADALAAHHAGRIRVTEARASEFIGPRVQPAAGISAIYGTRVLAGKTVYVMGDPDAPHSWSYMPDIARTLAALGTDERAWGQAWHVPSPPPMSVRRLTESVARLASAGPVRIRRIPRALLRTVGLAMPLVRELDGMMYQWERPFEIDATVTTATFGIHSTAWDEVLHQTVDYWRATIGR